MLIDSHFHLDLLPPEARAGVLDRARAAGVGQAVTIGTNLAQSANLLSLIAPHDNLWCMAGVHPHEAGDQKLAAPATIAAMADHPKVIGFGETGLDYHYEHAPRQAQQDSFRAHIAAARSCDLPIAIHSRAADDDTIGILRDEYVKGPFAFLLHCFSSGRSLAQAAVALGGYISFSGILTFPKSAELRAIAGDLPMDRLLVETDAPYLAPVPFRGRTNEPAYVTHTAATLAEIHGQTVETIATITTENFRRLFRRVR